MEARLSEIAINLENTMDVDGCMKNLRELYPNVNTLRNIISKIRKILIHRGVRHRDYEALIDAHRERIRHDSSRMSVLDSFVACPLERQVHIQKKLRVDPSFCRHTEDRQFFRTLPLFPEYIRSLRLSNHEHHEWTLRSQRSILDGSRDVIKIEDVAGIVMAARRTCKESTDPQRLAVALAILTGRRMVEIMLKGVMDCHSCSRYVVVFRGQAKTGLTSMVSMEKDEDKAYKIPTLGRGKVICEALERLRRLVGETTKTPADVNSKWCRKLNDEVKRSVHPGMTFHDLRTLYALSTFEAFKPHRYSLNGWCSQVLGHTGIGMSVHYTRMQVFGFEKISRSRREFATDFIL